MTTSTAPIHPLRALESALEGLRQRFGPYVVAPPADAQSPVVILLSPAVRYCVAGQHFVLLDDMHAADTCRVHAGQP